MFERFEFSSKGYIEMMQSDGVAADLRRRAEAVAAAARADLDDPDWDISVRVGPGASRVSATVHGVPMREEVERRILGRAIDAAR